MPDTRDETAKSWSDEEHEQSGHAQRFWRLPAAGLMIRTGRDEPPPAPEGKQRQANEGTSVLQDFIGKDPIATHLPQEGLQRWGECDHKTVVMRKRIPQEMGGCPHEQ